MPPQKKSARKSAASIAAETKQHGNYPHLLPTKHASPIKSPRRSPLKRYHGITQTQKELFIHNLQLEITFKARGLRAQANFEAAQLRSTLEQRLQRIPMAVRKAKMGELLDRRPNPQPTRDPVTLSDPEISLSVAAQIVQTQKQTNHNDLQSKGPRNTRPRGVKRSSHEAGITSDKENGTVSNPKKRTRTANMPTNTSEATRHITASQVLSPKSNNLRPLPPQSPSRLPISPSKTAMMRPVSPIKPVALPKPPTKPAAITKPVRGPARTASTARNKRTAALAPTTTTTSTRRRSNTSDRSSGAATTIVSKSRKVTGPVQTAAAAKKKAGTFSGVPAKGKRVAAAVGKMEDRNTANAAASGAARVLRKRA